MAAIILVRKYWALAGQIMPALQAIDLGKFSSGG